jgi:hypothetical protein
MRIKRVKYIQESESITKVVLTMRKPKPQSLIRKRMYWASCYKWDMYMYRKLKE